MNFCRVENINWNRLKLFYYVAKVGSFARAAEVLNISQPALSRHIQVLEHSFKKDLFLRHARGVLLTCSGTKIFQATERMMREMGSLQDILNDKDSKYEETLKVSIPPYLASTWLYKKLNYFLSSHSNLRLEISTNMLPESLENMDIIIGIKLHDRRHLIQYPLPFLTMPIGLFASTAYLQHKGVPSSLTDLDNHHLISYEDSTKLPYENSPWILRMDKELGHKRKPYLVVSTLEGLISAAKDGLGIVELPKNMPEILDAKLIPVLAEVEGPLMEIYFSYSQQMSDSNWIIALRDYLGKQN